MWFFDSKKEKYRNEAFTLEIVSNLLQALKNKGLRGSRETN